MPTQGIWLACPRLRPGGHYVLVDENRNERYVRMTPLTHRQVLPAMAKSIPMANTFATYRRQVWVQAGGYPIVTDLEDLLFWLEAAKLAPVALTPFPNSHQPALQLAVARKPGAHHGYAH